MRFQPEAATLALASRYTWCIMETCTGSIANSTGQGRTLAGGPCRVDRENG
jgi:hypothetical protein